MSHPWKHSRLVGRGSEQPYLAEDVTAHCSGIGLDDLERSLPTQTVIWFNDSVT